MATGKGTRRKDQSICKNSALIAVNLVRASSFVLSDMILGLPPDRSGGGRAPIKPPPVPPQDRSMPLQRVPGSRSTAYVMEPDDGNDVDARAAEYILNFKRKIPPNERVVAEASKCIPPPPPSRKWYDNGR